MRTINELTETSYCQRRGFVTLELGRAVSTSWTFVSGNSYSTPISEFNDNIPLEIGSVTTSAGDWLDRVDSSALCGTTSSSYYFAPSTDGVSSGTLYVNLPSSGNPNNFGVQVGFWKLFGSSGTVEPLLGAERVTDPRIDNWTDFTTPTSYTVLAVGADIQVQRDAVNVLDGPYSAKVVALNLAAGTSDGISQGGVIVAATGLYHVRVVYSTSPNLAATAEATLRVRTRVAPSALYLGTDGRHTNGTADGLTLQSTYGEIREALFAIRVPTGSAAGIQLAFLLYNGGGSALTTGYANLYYMSLKPVYRYDYAEARLTMDGLPSFEQSNNDIFMGAESVGTGALKVLNTDDQYMETLLEGFDVNGRVAQGWLGGGFDNGQEIPLGSCYSGFRGTTQSFSVDDLSATFDLQDTRSLLGTVLPLETIGRRYAGQPGVSDDDTGRPVPILIGAPKYNMKCPRVSLETTKRLPIWLVNDPTYSTGSDIMGQVNVWAYTDDDAANRRDTTRRVQCEFTNDNATGLVTLFSNPGPFEVLGDVTTADVVRAEVKPNDTLDFVDNVTTRAAALTPGLYTCTTLAAHAQTVMNAFGGGTFTVAYSNTAHTFTFTKTGGVGIFSLLLNTGANKHRSAFPLFGFSGNADSTGASSYTSSVALYDETKADQFVIRIDATGYRDNTDGRFTGVTGGGDTAIIYQGPDILRFLLVQILKRPTSEIDSTSFNAFRGVGKLTHVIYLGGFGPSSRLTLQQIVDRIEVTTHTDIVMDGQGKWFWKSRPVSSGELTTLGANAPVLTDRDFIEFRSFKSAEDTYSGVSMTYDEHPVTGQVKSREASNTLVAMRHNRAGARSFDGLWFEAVDAQAQAWNMMLLAVLPRRHFEFTVKGRLLGKIVGDIIRIQRTRMLGPEVTGMANEDVARIKAISVDPQTHLVHCEAYTADLPRNTDIVALGLLANERRSNTTSGPWKPTYWPRPVETPFTGRNRPALL